VNGPIELKPGDGIDATRVAKREGTITTAVTIPPIGAEAMPPGDV